MDGIFWEKGEEAVILGNDFICNEDIKGMHDENMHIHDGNITPKFTKQTLQEIKENWAEIC